MILLTSTNVKVAFNSAKAELTFASNNNNNSWLYFKCPDLCNIQWHLTVMEQREEIKQINYMTLW